MTEAERLAAEIAARQAMVRADEREFLERIKTELVRAYERQHDLQREIDRLQAEIERYEFLARWWCRKARLMQHGLGTSMVLVQDLAQRLGDPEPKFDDRTIWPDMVLPNFDAPKNEK